MLMTSKVNNVINSKYWRVRTKSLTVEILTTAWSKRMSSSATPSQHKTYQGEELLITIIRLFQQGIAIDINKIAAAIN